MKGFSKAIVAGNLTRDPEMRTTPSGQNVCSFGLAVGRRYKDASGNFQEATSFLNCVAWGKAGETINQYMRKGSPILVSGRLDQRSWDDKTTGQKRSAVEIVVEEFTFLGGGSDNRSTGNNFDNTKDSYGSSNTADTGNAAGEEIPDDIPNADIDVSEIPF